MCLCVSSHTHPPTLCAHCSALKQMNLDGCPLKAFDKKIVRGGAAAVMGELRLQYDQWIQSGGPQL